MENEMRSSTMESLSTTSSGELAPLSLENDPPNRLFHVAVGENNAGVDFYNKGDYKSSIRALHRSLDCMERFSKHHLEQQKQQRREERFQETRIGNDTSTPCCGNCCSPRSSASLPLVRDDNYAIRVPNTKTKPTSNTKLAIHVNLNAMYSCALCLSCHGDCWEALANPLRSCSGSDLARIKASIFFNLGLAHHRQAGTILDTDTDSSVSVSSSSSSATLLEQAILLYKLSLSLQESEDAPISPEHIMALCNNLGQCHVSLLRHHEARTWNERLLRLLICHGQKKASCTTNSSTTTTTHNSHYHHLHKCECFFQNTLSLILQDPCLSPAA